MKIIARSADELYHAALAELLTNGKPVAPRGQATHERTGCHLTLTDPHQNVISFPTRKLNYAFMVAEWLFIMSGGNDAGLLTPFNSRIGEFSEDGRFAGAYGPKVMEQFAYVVDTLRADPMSRQAVLTIWRERPRASKDVPCTVAMQFLLREGALELIVYMRSNDAWLGLPYDLFNFTQLQRVVASTLGVHVGAYHHMVGSLHLYDRNASTARAVLADQDKSYFTHHYMTSTPLTEAVGAMYRIATTPWQLYSAWQRDSTIEHIRSSVETLDDEWRAYIDVLLWSRARLSVVPEAPWYGLTRGRVTNAGH